MYRISPNLVLIVWEAAILNLAEGAPIATHIF